MLSPATYELVDRLVETVGKKTGRQASRYSDDRAAVAQTIAPAGRRLRARVSVAAVIVTVVWVGLQVFELVEHIVQF